MTNKYIPVLLVAAACLAGGCKPESPYNPPVQPVDYSVADHWMSAPQNPTKAVDVFYVYPTAYHQPDPFYSDVDDPLVRSNVAYDFKSFGSCFETVGNIYAPYYRQATVSILDHTQQRQGELIDSIPAVDIYAAFDYYIRHYNGGRPFIVAAHSQGSDVAMRAILSRYLGEHPAVYGRMVAAYMLGYSVTQSYLDANRHLKFATGATDLQVIISYNTEDGNVTVKNPVAWPGSIAINPINWKRDETPATAAENLASRIDPDRTEQFQDVTNYADARVDPVRGVVVCTTVDAAAYDLRPLFPLGCFHGGDYPFYYYSLRRNAQDRVDAYLAR